MDDAADDIREKHKLEVIADWAYCSCGKWKVSRVGAVERYSTFKLEHDRHVRKLIMETW
jgi:hypothetical protein